MSFFFVPRCGRVFDNEAAATRAGLGDVQRHSSLQSALEAKKAHERAQANLMRSAQAAGTAKTAAGLKARFAEEKLRKTAKQQVKEQVAAQEMLRDWTQGIAAGANRAAVGAQVSMDDPLMAKIANAGGAVFVTTAFNDGSAGQYGFCRVRNYEEERRQREEEERIRKAREDWERMQEEERRKAEERLRKEKEAQKERAERQRNRPPPSFSPPKNSKKRHKPADYQDGDCPYELLGLPKTATLKQAKQKFKELVLKYHPDKTADDPPEERDKKTKLYIRLKDAIDKIRADKG